MSDPLKPENEDQVRDIVAAALADQTPLEVVGAGSKRALGRHAPLNRRLDLSALSGITLYEPDELVLSARAATPLEEIETALAAEGQCLAFEPPDWGSLWDAAEAQTIGGVLACNLAGPRRLRAGAARDHFLGVHAVSGRGEVFKSGGRVVKNVTGYDMCKLMAGSYGTLGVMTDVTVKVLPVSEKTRTVLVFGLSDGEAIRALSGALNGPFDVSAAAHLPRAVAARSDVGYVRDAGAAVTAVRIEGPDPSVIARCDSVRDLWAPLGQIEELHRHNSSGFWRGVGDAASLAEPRGRAIWRLSVAPSGAPDLVAGIASRTDAEAFYDWGGGLIWLAVADDAAAHAVVRAAVDPTGGHATLIRAAEDIRAEVAVFQPQTAAVAGLTERIKQGFDPEGILNPGRMYAGV